MKKIIPPAILTTLTVATLAYAETISVGVPGEPNSIVLEPSDPNDWPHTWASYAWPNLTDPFPNNVMGIGYNVGPGNGRADPNRHGAWLSIEGYYEASPGNHLVEMFFQYYAADNTSRRPIGATISLETNESNITLIGTTKLAGENGNQIADFHRSGLVRIHEGPLLFESNGTAVLGNTAVGYTDLLHVTPTTMFLDVNQKLTTRVHSQSFEVMHNATFEGPVYFANPNRPVVTSCEDLMAALDSIGLIDYQPPN